MTSTSSNYKQGHHSAVTSAHALRTAEVEGAFVLPHVKPHFHILDVGCGPGTITTGFAKRVPQGSVIGIDLSADVISQANTYLSNMEAPPQNVTFATGDILQGLDLPSESFDMAFCSQTLLHIPNPVAALREMKRLVKPGGLIACREADLPFHYYPELSGIQASHRYLWMLFTGAHSPDSRFPDSYPHPPGHRAGSMVHGFARQAGCDPARITKGATVDVYATPEERKWRAQNMIDRIEQGGHREKFLGLGASEGEIEEMVRDWRIWEEDVDAWYAVLQCEVVCWV